MSQLRVRHLLCIFCIFLCLLFAVKASGEEKTKAIFGLPLEAPQFQNKTPEEIAQYLKQCSINAVVGVPFDNKIIDQLRESGIKAYAEILLFSGKEHWEEKSESRPVLPDGSFMEADGWYSGVCPTQEWLILRKIEEARDIARKYHIDGLWLDFIRWPGRWELKQPRLQDSCYCSSCLSRFQREKNIKIPGDLKTILEVSWWIEKHHSRDWYAWRCSVIADTIKKIRGALRNYRKDAIIGIFLVPWREQDFDNAIYKIIGQDIGELSEVVDVFSPMSYHLLCGRDTDWITSVTKWIKFRTEKEVWVTVQSIDEPEEISAAEFKKALEAGFAGGSSGVINYNASASLEDEEKWQAQKEVFSKY